MKLDTQTNGTDRQHTVKAHISQHLAGELRTPKESRVSSSDGVGKTRETHAEKLSWTYILSHSQKLTHNGPKVET